MKCNLWSQMGDEETLLHQGGSIGNSKWNYIQLRLTEKGSQRLLRDIMWIFTNRWSHRNGPTRLFYEMAERFNQMINNWILIIWSMCTDLRMRTINIINEMKNWFHRVFNCSIVRIDGEVRNQKCEATGENVLGTTFVLIIPLRNAVCHRDSLGEKNIFFYL